MKIGIVCYPTFGGSGVVATELGIALAKAGHQIHFISYSQPVRLDFVSENIFYHEVQVSNYPLFDYQPYELVLASKLVDVVKHESLDLLHVHYAIPHASAAYMARQILRKEGLYIPFITTLHGTDITLLGRDASFEPVISFTIQESDAVTAVSESLRADTYAYFRVTRDIEVIPNFIPISEYQESKEIGSTAVGCRKQMFAPNGERILMHISNFRKVKRVEDVVEIFDRVNRSISSVLLMIGDGPERGKAEQLCREKGLFEKVKFMGKITSPEQVLRVADLFVLPSATESFGLAALEAMAAGVPVISTNTGGLPEVNRQGVSGFLSDVGDVEEMAKNAVHILSDSNTLEQFRKQALQEAKRFDLPVVLPLYENLYKQVLRESKQIL